MSGRTFWTLALVVAIASPALAGVLVTRDGRRLETAGGAVVRDGLNLYRTCDGMALALLRDEIDEPATEEANRTGSRPGRCGGPGRGPAVPGEARWISREEPSLPAFPLSFDVREAPIVDILRVLAEAAGINLVVHPGVKGTLTMDVDAVPWDRILELVLRPHGLEAQYRGSVLYVAPVDAFLKEIREEDSLRRARGE
jgi:hypothetical protein